MTETTKMGFDEAAARLAERVRGEKFGFLTLRREELRAAFDIGKLTEGQSAQIAEALGRQGIYVFPPPYISGPSLRLYDQKHPLASLAESVTRPDAIPETALHRAAVLIERDKAGKDLRSDDAPWLVAFDLFLQVVLGREPDGWEELRDDRHSSELARELAVGLGLGAAVAERLSTLRLAAAVCAFRPRGRRRWQASDLAGPDDAEASILPLIDGLAAANGRLKDEHNRLLRQAARLLRRADDIPDHHVELGRLGLRYRQEDGDEA